MNLTKRVDYFATKFDSPQTECLYDLAAEWMLDYDGTSEAPCGWWQAVSVTPYDLRAYIVVSDSHDESLNVLVHARAPFDSIIGHWLIRGNDQGFVWTAQYDTYESLKAAMSALSDEFNAWDEQGEWA